MANETKQKKTDLEFAFNSEYPQTVKYNRTANDFCNYQDTVDQR